MKYMKLWKIPENRALDPGVYNRCLHSLGKKKCLLGKEIPLPPNYFWCFILQRCINLGVSPCRVTVTTRHIICLVGNPYKPFFATVTGRRENPISIYIG